MAVVRKPQNNTFGAGMPAHVQTPLQQTGTGIPQKQGVKLGNNTQKTPAAKNPAQNPAAQNPAQNPAAGGTNGWNSPYKPQMDSILNQILNMPEFKYEFNSDPLFQYYSDLYQNQGTQAMQDTIGQAAAMTGGYGNSYGAAVGNQAYQSWLSKIYDKGLEFRNAAQEKYNQNLSNLYNQYGTLSAADQQAYQQWWNQKQAEEDRRRWEQEQAMQREQWEWQKAQAEAAGTGGGGGGPRSNNGDDDVIYFWKDGQYFKKNPDGKVVPVNSDEVPDDAPVDTNSIPAVIPGVVRQVKKMENILPPWLNPNKK